MTDLPRLLARLLPGEPVGIILPDGVEGSVTADHLVLVKKGRAAGAIVRTIAGEEFPAAQDFAALVRRLSAPGNWFKPHSDHLVNLDHLKLIRKVYSGRYDLTLTGEAVAPLTSTYSADLKSRLALDPLDSLDHVMPFDRVAYWILKENLREFEKPIHLMTRQELIAAFGSTGAADVIVSELIGNFLWQFVNRIRAGLQAPLEGMNVRSLWYIIKPALSKVNALGGMDHYKTLSEKLADFVSKGMMRYREFGLAEEENWAIGDRRPEVIVAAEKRGHFRFLQTIQKEFGVSVIALAGKPKTITSEYFTDAFKAKVSDYWKKDRVRVIGLIDYDPSGWIIGRTFLDDLRVFGIKHAKLIDLVTPSNFTPEELESYKYSLLKPNVGSSDNDEPSASDATTLKKWMKKYHGVNDEPYGLETDALMITPDRVKVMIVNAINS